MQSLSSIDFLIFLQEGSKLCYHSIIAKVFLLCWHMWCTNLLTTVCMQSDLTVSDCFVLQISAWSFSPLTNHLFHSKIMLIILENYPYGCMWKKLEFLCLIGSSTELFQNISRM